MREMERGRGKERNRTNRRDRRRESERWKKRKRVKFILRNWLYAIVKASESNPLACRMGSRPETGKS